jgi:PPK2 family polyphosphate:nucleotide phosphotransferase
LPGRWRVDPSQPLSLADIDPASTAGAPGDRAETESESKKLGKELADLQTRLWAEKKSSLLVVMQGMDTSGKDGTIKRVFGAVNPLGLKITSFRAPTEEELAHDFLWRVHKVSPATGEIAVFNRSHYEDVLVVRVLDLVPDDVWGARYELINDFESQLAHRATAIVKLFLHISKDEQRLRLQKRVDNPAKRWKFNAGDLEQRARWDEYMAAYEDALVKTSTDAAPWYVVPADRKWFRNWVVNRILVTTLRGMNPAFPEGPEDLPLTIE